MADVFRVSSTGTPISLDRAYAHCLLLREDVGYARLRLATAAGHYARGEASVMRRAELCNYAVNLVEFVSCEHSAVS